MNTKARARVNPTFQIIIDCSSLYSILGTAYVERPPISNWPPSD